MIEKKEQADLKPRKLDLLSDMEHVEIKKLGQEEVKPVYLVMKKTLWDASEAQVADIVKSGFSNFEMHGIITHNTVAPFGECVIEIIFNEAALNPVMMLCTVSRNYKLIGTRNAMFQIKKEYETLYLG